MLNPAKIVRSFVNKDVTVYNDKIKNGRSVKIVGYKPKDYSKIVNILNNEGFTVNIVKTPKIETFFGVGGGEYRIHIY